MASCPDQQGFIHSPSPDVREVAAHLMGLVTGSHGGWELSLMQAKGILQDTYSEVPILKSAVVLQSTVCSCSKVYHVRHGAILALGHVVANLLQFCVDVECLDVVRKALERLSRLIGPEVMAVTCALSLVHLIVKENQHPLSLAACVSMGQVCRCGPLPLSDTSSQTDVLAKELLVHTLSDKLRTSSDMKVTHEAQLATMYPFVLCS